MNNEQIVKIRDRKQRKPLTKSDKIGLLIFFLAPIGLIVMWLKSGWTLRAKLLVTLVGILWTIFGVWFWTQDTKPTIAPPKIVVSNSVEEDGKFVVESYLGSVTITTGKVELKEKTTLTVNSKNIEPSTSNLTQFMLDLKDKSTTEYKVTAENANGKDEAIILVRNPEPVVQEEKEVMLTPEPSPSTDHAETDAVFEAEITCQEHAESYFRVEDINIHYDQASIKRKNSDGSILIKVNIADSQGLLRSEKSLGTMECTTASDGLRVLSFSTY